MLTHAPKADAQVLDPGSASAQGGDGGSARGGAGARGGDGVLPTCNGNANAVDPGDDDAVECGAGGAGGAGGDAGISEAGDGGLAFTIGQPPAPAAPAPGDDADPVADVAVTQAGPAGTTCIILVPCVVASNITVQNTGTVVAQSVTLTDEISEPVGGIILSVVTGNPACAVVGVLPGSSATITCNLGDLAPGASAVIPVTVTSQVLAPVALTQLAHATTPTPEATLANNQATLVTSLHF